MRLWKEAMAWAAPVPYSSPGWSKSIYSSTIRRIWISTATGADIPSLSTPPSMGCIAGVGLGAAVGSGVDVGTGSPGGTAVSAGAAAARLKTGGVGLTCTTVRLRASSGRESPSSRLVWIASLKYRPPAMTPSRITLLSIQPSTLETDIFLFFGVYRSISRQTDPFSGRQLPGLPFYILYFSRRRRL